MKSLTSAAISPETKTYLTVYLALMLLLGLTWGSAYAPLGWFNPILNLLIAAAKSLLVILFFMHVRHAKALTVVFVVAGFFWLAFFVTITLSDNLTRGLLPVPGK